MEFEVGLGRNGKVTSRRVIWNGRELPASMAQRLNEGESRHANSDLLRGALVGLIALFGVGLQSANADSGSITLTIYKGGWIIGGSAGGGTLVFRGRSYRLGVGGIDYGLLFGGSKTVLHGRVSNIQRASDVAGVYAAAGAGLAVGRGVRAIVLTNQNGAILELSGRQVGLMANADLSGLAITMK